MRFQLDLRFVWDDDDVRDDLSESEILQLIEDHYKRLVTENLNLGETVVELSCIALRRAK